MPIKATFLFALPAAIVLHGASGAWAQSCRAQQIMASQCTWFALDELKGSKVASKKAEREATLELIDGCSQGAYQMVLMRGTGLSDGVVARLRARGTRDEVSVRHECALEARRASAS